MATERNDIDDNNKATKPLFYSPTFRPLNGKRKKRRCKEKNEAVLYYSTDFTKKSIQTFGFVLDCIHPQPPQIMI